MRKNNRLLSAGSLLFDGLFSTVLPRKPHILIACMPKSASTYLASALAELPGFRRCRLTPDWGAREQELCSIRLSRYNHSQYVSQHHLRYSGWTAQLIDQYNLTPVVLVRDLADCAISIRDHNQQKPGEGPTAYFDETHLEMENAEFEEAVVRLAIPWYINFYAGWRAAKNVPIYDYEDYTQDPVKVMTEIIEQTGLKKNPEGIEQALISVSGGEATRFNVGKSGRGSQLSRGAKDSLLRLMEFYPDLQNDPLFIKTRETIS